MSAFQTDPDSLEHKLGDLDPTSLESMQGFQQLFGDPEVMLGAIQSDRQRELLPLLEALIAVIEGYVDHVMDRIGGQLISSYGRVTEAVRRRRVEASSSDRFVERLFGLELTQDRYDRGTRFIDGVVERAGEAVPRAAVAQRGRAADPGRGRRARPVAGPHRPLSRRSAARPTGTGHTSMISWPTMSPSRSSSQPIGPGRGPTALGRAARVEQALTVDADLVDGLVAVAEHDDRTPGNRRRMRAARPFVGPLSWIMRHRHTGQRHLERLGQHAGQRVVVVAEHRVDRGDGRGARPADRRRARHRRAGSRRPPPAGRTPHREAAWSAPDRTWVSASTAARTRPDLAPTVTPPAAGGDGVAGRRGSAPAGCGASPRAAPLREAAPDLARHLGEPLLDLDRRGGGRRDPGAGAMRRRQTAEDVGERGGAGDHEHDDVADVRRHLDRHRQERADDPRDLEPGLEPGEGAAPVRVRRVALQDRVERQLPGRAGHTDGRREDARARRRRRARSPPPRPTTASASDAVEQVLLARSSAGCAARSPRPPGRSARSRRPPPRTATWGRLRLRKSNASSNVRKPTMPRSSPMAEPAMRIPDPRSSTRSV